MAAAGGAMRLEDIPGKKISVIGARRSGIAAARQLSQIGALVTLSDANVVPAFGSATNHLSEAENLNLIVTSDPEVAVSDDTSLIVPSPGVPRDSPMLIRGQNLGIPIWSEIELAERFRISPMAAVTGTNGKTTTTILLASMLLEAGIEAIPCGNVSADEIKCTLLDAALSAKETDPQPILVAEISSFQLEWVDQFAPDVAILTNITPDHMNRYASFEDYCATKSRIFAAQKSEQWAIIGLDNEASRRIGEAGVPSRLLWFSNETELPEGLYGGHVRDNILTVVLPGKEPVSLFPVSLLPPSLPGAHSIQNVLAASLAAILLGADAFSIQRAVTQFKCVPHRMEIIREMQGVRFINNSMCTNAAAAVSSLQGLDRPAVVIMGGAGKNLDYLPIASVLKEKAKYTILIGQVADEMESCFNDAGYSQTRRADSLSTAVSMAWDLASRGDCVILCPASASFDMFRDFEARGEAFRDAVRSLEEVQKR